MREAEAQQKRQHDKRGGMMRKEVTSTTGDLQPREEEAQ
jgi:hypothetical protein